MNSKPLFYPQGLRSGAWNPVRQASCEAIHRAVTTRNVDPTGCGLRADTLRLEQRIQEVVSATPDRALERILVREITRHGYVNGGWSTRWPDPNVRPASAPPTLLPSSRRTLEVYASSSASKAVEVGSEKQEENPPEKRLA
ncbi:MAG: hypothetical protein EOO38_05755 [Cytophagaceae bacterium]|jgi:hypothetical protein|nr:MAG: hypothetical protein EOO38_05755 [Cytophagaceae bacterium]